MVPADKAPLPLKNTDADVIWLYDIPAEIGVFPHDSAHCSILAFGQFLYINTNSGLTGTHKDVRTPEGPSLIVLDKATGRLVARDDENIGPNIIHSTWSSPAVGQVNGQTRVFFCGGDGVCYAFEPVPSVPADGIAKLQRLWRFDCDPTAPRKTSSSTTATAKSVPATSRACPSSTTTACTSPSAATSGGASGSPGSSASMRRGRATPPTTGPSGPFRCRPTAARPPRSGTAWPSSPTATATCTASISKRARPTGHTSATARSGPRRSWPTARCTSGRDGVTSGFWRPTRTRRSSIRSGWTAP